MGVNKVNYGGRKVLDISDTTTVAADVPVGKYFYNADGDRTAGTQVIQTFYTGTAEPSSSLGNNGDLYLKVVE